MKLPVDDWWNERESPCPGCGHLLGEHLIEIGCTNGWDYDDGCECGLTLAGQHNPPSERDRWSAWSAAAP